MRTINIIGIAIILIMDYTKSIAIFSDIHIHPHGQSVEKLEDCIKCLEWIYQESVERKIPYIIFAGDLFHDRHRINIFAYNKTYDILKKYAKKIESYYLVGNHDMFYKSSRNVNSLKPFSELINVVDNTQTIDFNGIPIDFLPYTESTPLEELKKIKSKKSKILIGHMSVSGAILNSTWGTRYKEDDLVEDISETPIKPLSGYQRVFLGHFHARQQVSKNIEYIGSPLQLSFGEAMDKKGFLILDPNKLETEFVENNFTPKYYILPHDSDFSEFDLENSYLKVITSSSSNIDQITIKEEITNRYKPKTIEVIMPSSESESIKLSEEISGVEDFTVNTTDIIKSFINSVETDLDKEKLIKIGIKITQTIDDKEIKLICI